MSEKEIAVCTHDVAERLLRVIDCRMSPFISGYYPRCVFICLACLQLVHLVAVDVLALLPLFHVVNIARDHLVLDSRCHLTIDLERTLDLSLHDDVDSHFE